MAATVRTAAGFDLGELQNPISIHEDACPGCGETGELSYTGSLRRDLLLDPDAYARVRRCYCAECKWHGWARKAGS